MARRRNLRRVVAPPGFKGYRPYGHSRHQQGAVELYYEEYEAIKLADYDSLNHLEASKIMGISRATFARIYSQARQKIALALVESREITTVFGYAFFDKSWYQCPVCHSKFTIPAQKEQAQLICPLCGSKEIKILNIK